ncbi:MAG: cobalt ECF transporter T component CbiQ [Candidatus Brocadiia bacterium]
MRHAFLDQYSALESPVHRLDARAKIIAFLALIVIAVSTPPEAWTAFLGYGAFLFVMAAASCLPVGHILRRAWVIVPFVAMTAIFIPFMKTGGAGGGYSFGVGSPGVQRSGMMIFWNLLIKSGIAVFSMILLSSTTPFPSLMRGFERLKAPRVMVMLASFAYRYIFVLVDEAERMERARDSRCYAGRWLWHAKVIGQMIGTLFLRSYERAERVYVAMASRGFDGRIVTPAEARMAAADGAFVAASVGFFVALRVWT